MNAQQLFDQLDKDFELDSLTDEWSIQKTEYITDQFLERFMGIMLDNSNMINKVYTATFPDLVVLDQILAKNETNILLVTHHPMIWDSRIEGYPFKPIPQQYYLELRKRKISLYVLHHPLDKNGTYSTATSYAKALKLDIIGEFCEYLGINVGIIGKTQETTLNSLERVIENIVGHPVKVWNYGDEKIAEGKVCVTTGGGNLPFIIEEVSKLGLNTYLTGNTKPVPSFPPSIEFHDLARKKKVNIIAATHYSTEKFACMALIDYFKQLGLPCEFIEGTYLLEDYE